ncbi:hypothetical protein BD324DRAFT_650140 [Kockovaella imperatae]|uniref:Glycosyltransferase 61 catalytic domain-containing protein n=1 Tax=Kockovaella imperatae TaxID=4999 RepID=A0A1Y1UJ37_9TREE|nr:hypothetical protein BD324DRAFT_650140 [Kockovaella imperatae]ORX37567.1 hypothetical protein BD324DRAFT_650140 [Kockovaella imperatae]
MVRFTIESVLSAARSRLYAFQPRLDGYKQFGSRRNQLPKHAQIYGIAAVIFLLLFTGYSFSDHFTAPTTAPTIYEAGIPGFNVFRNVWYNNQTFHLWDPTDAAMPVEDSILSPRTKAVVHTEIPIKGRHVVYLKGASLLINEKAGDEWSGLWHYYHFAAEAMLGGLTAFSIAESVERIESPQAYLPVVPDRLIIPWDSNWHDRWGINPLMVDALFDDVLEPEQWGKWREHDNWIFFDQLIIVDRWAAHRYNKGTQAWNKMSVDIFERPHPFEFFAPVRQRLMKHFGFHEHTSTIPNVVYVDRQSSDRRLVAEHHEALVALLRSRHERGEIKFVHAAWENHTVIEQFHISADADIMVGVHGNGLTHEMWMTEKATLVELFHPGVFLRDYQAVAHVLGHQYFAVWNDTLHTQAEWEADPGEKMSWMTHSGTEFPLYVPFFETLLDRLLAGV